MCGLAGVVGGEIPGSVLERMDAALAHRGPDDSGTFTEPGLALVHRRLSILDVDGGRQPMSSPDERYVIVYNGEIYNYEEPRDELAEDGYRFRTRSDTEVLLALYAREGERMLTRLRGQFAFAMWDREEERLFLARDHYGQKPLFWYRDGTRFLFASEIKALLATPWVQTEPDLESLYHYAGLRFCPGDRTLFEGVHKLPPASWMRISAADGHIERGTYWDPLPGAPDTRDEGELLEELEERMEESIRLHLVSDVPVGVFLSGGVDSGIVTALAARQTPGLPSFSVGPPDADFSELDRAAVAAKHCGTEHHPFEVTLDALRMVPDLVWHMEEPGDPHGAGIMALSERASQHVKVVLGGDGADELFAGYTRHRAQLLTKRYARIPGWMRRRLVRPLVRLIPESFRYYSLASTLRWINEASFLSPAEQYYHGLVFFRFPDEIKRKLFTSRVLSQVGNIESRDLITPIFEAPDTNDPLARMLYADMRTRMAEHYLLISDRMSMALGLELRAPFLDPRLGEFVSTIPGSLKIRKGRQKYLLRKFGERYLPREHLDEEKRGFAFPLGRWFQGPLGESMVRTFADSRIVAAGILRDDTLQELLSEHRAGDRDHGFRLWMALNLEAWYRVFFAGDGVAGVREWLDDVLAGSHTGASPSARKVAV